MPRSSWLELVEAGDVVNRQLVMHNDFIIVGPQVIRRSAASSQPLTPSAR